MRKPSTARIFWTSLGTVGAGAALVVALTPWTQAARADSAPAPSPTATSVAPSATPTAPATSGSAAATQSATSASAAPPSSPPSSAAPSSMPPRPRATTGNPPAGAAYLVKQLTGGDHVESSYVDAGGKTQTFADYGGTADVAIALASSGSQDATLAKVIAYLDAHVADYADPKGTAGGPYDGAAGKLALVTEIVQGDPHNVGSTDLISLLTSTVCTAATQDGACSAAGDFHGAYSGVGQVLPILALARAGATIPPAALLRLAQLQCSDGGFSSDLIAPGAACASDVDTTGAALQALVLLPSESAFTQRAAAYLLAQQKSDGGFSGAAGENANSTALVVQGLLASGASASAVTNGLSFLAALQQGDGGLKVNAAGKSADLRATDQSVPALARTTLTTLTHPVAAAPSPTPTPTPTPTTLPTVIATAPSPTTTTTTGARGATTGTPTPGAPGASGALPYTGSDAGLWFHVAAELLLFGTALVAVTWRLRARGRRAR